MASGTTPFTPRTNHKSWQVDLFILRRTLIKQKAWVRFLREIAVIKNMSHPCIVKFLDASTSPDDAYLVMEWAPLGSLDQHVKTVFKGDAWRTLRMARDIAS